MKRHINIPIFVPHLGCPHDCIFCNQTKISGAAHHFDEAAVRAQIDTYTQSIGENTQVEIAFFGGSFTGIEWPQQKAYLDLATTYVHRNGFEGIRMSTRPDLITPEILDRLTPYPITTIELGVQSMDSAVLAASHRGHSAKDVYTAAKLIRHYGFGLGLQMMLGLPGDTWDKSLTTADKLIALDPDGIRLYPTLVVRDTALAHMYIEGTYTPWPLNETLQLCAQLVHRFTLAGIKIFRLGLQATDQMQPGKDILAGPYHPAIGQLVAQQRLVDYILKYLADKKKAQKSGPIILEAGSKMYQSLVGHKKSHLPIWASHRPVIEIRRNISVPDGMICIDGAYVRRGFYW